MINEQIYLGTALLLIAIFTQSSVANEKDTRTSEETGSTTQASYESETFDASNGIMLPYRIFRPDNIGTAKLPLLIFLHGAGERGTDNQKQLKHGAKEFTRVEFQKKHPCIVIAPQCREDRMWCNVDWTVSEVQQPTEASQELFALFELLDSMLKRESIDPDRIYITGLSMGGFGTWDAIARRPSFFAAAVPICGGGDPSTAVKLAKLPVWCFHGDADPVVSVALSRAMVSALKNASGTVKYTEYEGVAHDSWTATYQNPELYEWLFLQTKAAQR